MYKSLTFLIFTGKESLENKVEKIKVTCKRKGPKTAQSSNRKKQTIDLSPPDTIDSPPNNIDSLLDTNQEVRTKSFKNFSRKIRMQVPKHGGTDFFT